MLLIQEVTWLDGVRPYNFPCSRVINNSWAMGNVFVQSVILYFRLDANFKIKDNTERSKLTLTIEMRAYKIENSCLLCNIYFLA